jgi:Na+/H+-dicarboxylate symporter
MKKGIFFELAVMTKIPLVIAAVVTSITLNIKKRSKIGTRAIRD